MTSVEQATRSIERRHDLDALRAFAMLLGIVLHGALAFIPGAWVVSDASVEGDGTGFAILTSAIHGFRMPVFFLMSGFFTAMLWRQRGMRSLLGQRARRILLPLVLLGIPIVALNAVAWSYAESAAPSDDKGAEAASEAAPAEGDANIWEAAAAGDVALLARFEKGGADLEEHDPVFGSTPLAWAALFGQVQAVEWLLDNGVSVHVRNKDEGTSLHSAAFMGRADVVQVLLAAGADPDAVHSNGSRPIQMAQSDPTTTAYWAGLLGVVYDPAELDAGRKETVELLASASRKAEEQARAAGGAAGEQADAAAGVAPYRETSAANVDEEDALLFGWYWELIYGSEFGGAFTQDIFSHLWFLWYLVWLVLAFALVVWAAGKAGLRLRLPSALVVTPLLYLWVVPLTMAGQYLMGVEGLYPTFGADTFTGLVPAPHVLAYYAVFFGFGAVYFAHNEDGARIGRGWQLTLPLAVVVVLFAGLAFTYPAEGGAAQGGARWASLLLQALYAWMMALGLMGLFHATLGAGRRWVRYLSDASYWLYLAHLPLIVALQGASQSWELPALLKLAALVAATTLLLLAVYQVGVRYTPVGTLLNGRRVRETRAAA